MGWFQVKLLSSVGPSCGNLQDGKIPAVCWWRTGGPPPRLFQPGVAWLGNLRKNFRSWCAFIMMLFRFILWRFPCLNCKYSVCRIFSILIFLFEPSVETDPSVDTLYFGSHSSSRASFFPAMMTIDQLYCAGVFRGLSWRSTNLCICINSR